jgi:ankyrin repeat protein
MSRGSRQETLRVPPVVDGMAGLVAQRLREAPDALDDVSRARMERTLLQVWHTRASAHVPLPSVGRAGHARGAWWAAALSGNLDQVPARLLTPTNLLLASKKGFTPMHAAAETGNLRQIPERLITTELLLARNDIGDTPLHGAASEGHLSQVPVRFLTIENLSAQNIDGFTPLIVATARGHGDTIPPHARPKPAGFMDRLRAFFGGR